MVLHVVHCQDAVTLHDVVDSVVVAEAEVNDGTADAARAPAHRLIAIREHGVRVVLVHNLAAEALAILQAHDVARANGRGYEIVVNLAVYNVLLILRHLVVADGAAAEGRHCLFYLELFMLILSIHCATTGTATANELHAETLRTSENISRAVAQCRRRGTYFSATLLLSFELCLLIHINKALPRAIPLIHRLVMRPVSPRVMHLIDRLHHYLRGFASTMARR